MTTSKTIKTVLIWLPSIPVIIFFIQNALDKIIHSNQSEKLVSNSAILFLTGVAIFIATALFFLYEKTIIAGTAILATYMTMVVFIHISKGKPFFLTILVVLLTIIARILENKVV